jgi:hypothetical protein
MENNNRILTLSVLRVLLICRYRLRKYLDFSFSIGRVGLDWWRDLNEIELFVKGVEEVKEEFVSVVLLSVGELRGGVGDDPLREEAS